MTAEKISGFGRYRGHSDAEFNDYSRHSCYVAMRDGVRLAVDYFLPARNGGDAQRSLPAILSMTPYNRAQFVDGELQHALSPCISPEGEKFTNSLRELSRHGYVIVIADVRGQGASFGAYTGCMSAEEARDGADLVAWLTNRPWCDGSIGMFGSSYGASTQFLTASQRPPGLKALFAAHSYFDAYDVFFPGGVRELSLPKYWGAMVDELAGRTAPSVVAPVGGDEGHRLLEEALAEHRSTKGATEIFARIYESPYRDGNGYFIESTGTGSQNLVTLLPKLREWAPPAYFWAGWNDYFPDQLLKWHLNWTAAPSRLTIGPWAHSPHTYTSPRDEEDLRLRAIESLRWFDYWLKSIDNGVLDEQPIHYAVQTSHRFREGGFENGNDEWEWRSSSGWPLDGTTDAAYFFAKGPSGTVAWVNDGRLVDSVSDQKETIAELRVDPTVSTGPQNRMGSSFKFLPVRYPEMSAIDARCLTWTSDPLERDLIVAGTPRLAIRLAANQPDAVIIAWFEDLDSAGRSTLISYGSLKASHREHGEPPYDAADSYWHESTREAVHKASALNADGSEVKFSLLPIANRFRPEHRIRLTLSGADYRNLESNSAGLALTVCSIAGTPALTLPVLPDSPNA